MGFRTVLIAVGTAGEDAALDRAMTIADGLGAHLNVLVLGVAPPPPASPYGIVSNDIWAGEIREGQEAARARAEAIKQRLAAGSVSTAVESQYVDRGTISTLAARSARYADLTLIAPQGEGEDPLQTWVLNGALFESGRPVLLLPNSETAFPKLERVMIAWDASVEASKAVRDAIELMQGAGEVHAVLIDPVPSFEGHGPEPGADLAAYLARHGISAVVHRLPKEGQAVSDILKRTATDLGADLIVMGGFGHSRLRQRIFGGTTTKMIRHDRVPVLMAH
jgi:nucleotide-binding universal stress UspA family protein